MALFWFHRSEKQVMNSPSTVASHFRAATVCVMGLVEGPWSMVSTDLRLSKPVVNQQDPTFGYVL